MLPNAISIKLLRAPDTRGGGCRRFMLMSRKQWPTLCVKEAMGPSKRTNSQKSVKKRKSHAKATSRPARRYSDDLKSVLDLSSDWYWEQDKNLRFTRFSGKSFAESGLDTARMIGKTRWEMRELVVDPIAQAAVQAKMDAREPFYDFEYKRVEPDGRVRYIVTSGTPVFDAAGRFTGYRGIAKDVTERIQTKLRFAIEHGVTRILAEAGSIADAAPRIIRLVCETLGWACGSRWEPDQGGEAIRCAETWGVASADVEAFLEATRRLPPSTQPGGLNRRAWAKGEPLWMRDVTQEATFRRAPDALKAGLRSAFAFPIKVGAQVIGVMEFFSHDIHQPDEELLNATRYIGSQIGQFMERKRAEEALRENEARFRSLTELSSDWYWEQDENLRFTNFSGTGLGATGIEAADLIGKTRWELAGMVFEPAARAALQAKLDARLPFYDFEYKHVAPDGNYHYLLTSGMPVFDASGRFTGYRGIAKDVTARRRGERLLALEHAVNRCLADAKTVSEAIKASLRALCESEGWECGRYFQVDEKAGLLRFTEAWGIADPSIERYIAASREVTYTPGAGMTGRVWQSGEPKWVSERGQHAGVSHAVFGAVRDVFIFPLIADGKTVGVCTFISRKLRAPDARLLQAVRVIGSQIAQFVQRKQAEEVLRRSEARFRSLHNLSSDWFWEQDAQFRFTQFDGHHISGDRSAFNDELGKTREEIGIEVDGGWETHRALLEAHRPFRDVVMWRHAPDGHTRYMSISGEPIFDEGRFVGYRGVGKDITARRHGEHLLALEHTVTRCLAEADTVSAALKAVIRAICHSQNWGCGRYFRVDEGAGVLRYEEFWCEPDAKLDDFIARSRQVTYTPGQGLAGKVWQSGKPVWLDDVTKNQGMTPHRAGAGTGLRGTFLFPVTAEGQVVGVLSFFSREVREPDERLLQAVRVIGSQIGQFVQRKRTEQATVRLGRMFSALSATNDAILHAESPEELYQRVCDAAVHGGKFSNISILVCEEGSTRLKAVAGAGMVPQQLSASHISVDETIPEGRGLVGMAFRTQQPCVSNDFLNDERTRPWHEIGRKANCRSAAALPLLHDGRAIGAVLIHYDELNAFDDEIVKLLQRMTENVSFALDNFAREAERRRAQERIQYLATHDGLTDLPNRVMFSQMLNVAIHSARRYNRRFAVLFLDLDRFKIINDTLGHEAGDTLLQEMAVRIRETLRSSDVVARLGGDEFVVLLQEVTEREQVAIVARKLLSAVIKPVVIRGQECRVTASIGVSMYPADAQDEQALMKNADMAMYFAKEEGKNNFQFYSKDIKAQSLERLTLETSLRRALEHEEFFLHYQAKVDLAAGTITGVEALLRWQHPDLGLVSPAQFIPLAEETGLIVPIGKWVLKTACAQNMSWQRAGLPPVCMAVNLSPRQFADENLLHDLAAVLQETGMAPELLELEITESMVMGNVDRAAKQLAAIKHMGVRLAIDDFGTGYSSLAQIKRFPIDTIKVDRSFIREIPRNAEDKAITEAIIAMGKSLSLTVVAEGVETLEQQTFLREHACNEMQGYYFSKPVAPEQFADLLRTHISEKSPPKNLTAP